MQSLTVMENHASNYFDKSTLPFIAIATLSPITGKNFHFHACKGKDDEVVRKESFFSALILTALSRIYWKVDVNKAMPSLLLIWELKVQHVLLP